MPMRATSKIVVEFVAVFVIGGVAGGLLTWCYTDNQLTSFMNKVANKPDAIVARVNKKYSTEYKLSPDEMAKIQPDIQAMAEKIYQERHQFGLDILSTLDEYHGKIAAQLTPEHRDTYTKAMSERRKKLNSMLLPDQGGADSQQ